MAGPWVISMTQGHRPGSPRYGSLPYLRHFATKRCLLNA